MKEYAELLYDSIGSDYGKEGINPHFICPQCRNRFEPKYKPVAALPLTLDFSQKVIFTCPNCNANITLFIAIHKDGDSLAICIQRSDAEGIDGIPKDWFLKS